MSKGHVERRHFLLENWQVLVQDFSLELKKHVVPKLLLYYKWCSIVVNLDDIFESTVMPCFWQIERTLTITPLYKSFLYPLLSTHFLNWFLHQLNNRKIHIYITLFYRMLNVFISTLHTTWNSSALYWFPKSSVFGNRGGQKGGLNLLIAPKVLHLLLAPHFQLFQVEHINVFDYLVNLVPK